MTLLRRLINKSLNPRTILTTRFFTIQTTIPNTFPGVPTSAYYDCLVNTAGREGDLETVRYLLNKRVRDCCFNTANTFKFITNTETSLSILDDLYKTLARLDNGFTRKSAYDSLVARLCKLKKIDAALRVVYIMASGGFGLSACSFHPILSALSRGKKLEEAWHVMELMREVKVSPDVTAYNYLLTAHCFRGNLAAASEVLKKIEEDGLAADGRTYDAVVLGACRSGDVEGAFALLSRMVDDGQTVFYSTYSHVISALLRSGYYEQAVKFVIVCGNKDVKLDTEIFGSLASKLISLGRNEECMFVLEEMNKRGLSMGHKLRDFYQVNVNSKTRMV